MTEESSYTVNLNNKGGQSSEFKNHWLKVVWVFFPPKLIAPAVQCSWYVNFSVGNLV